MTLTDEERRSLSGLASSGKGAARKLTHARILLLIQVAGFNLGLVMRRLLGAGTARGLPGLSGRVSAFVGAEVVEYLVLDLSDRACSLLFACAGLNPRGLQHHDDVGRAIHTRLELGEDGRLHRTTTMNAFLRSGSNSRTARRDDGHTRKRHTGRPSADPAQLAESY